MNHAPSDTVTRTRIGGGDGETSTRVKRIGQANRTTVAIPPGLTTRRPTDGPGPKEPEITLSCTLVIVSEHGSGIYIVPSEKVYLHKIR